MNYTDLGAQTADLAYTAMTEGMDGLEDYYVTEGGIKMCIRDRVRRYGNFPLRTRIGYRLFLLCPGLYRKLLNQVMSESEKQ